jgi:hypothetical protein
MRLNTTNAEREDDNREIARGGIKPRDEMDATSTQEHDEEEVATLDGDAAWESDTEESEKDEDEDDDMSCLNPR